MEIEKPNPNLLPGSLIASREKISTMSKKILLYIFFNNKRVFNIAYLVRDLGGDPKKFLEILFVLEGVGVIMRITEQDFIYVGVKGIMEKFHSK